MRGRVWVGVMAVLFASASTADSEDLKWFSSNYDETTVLAYGIPETDYAPIVLTCEKGDETVRLFTTHDAPGAKDRQLMSVMLSSEAGSVKLSATGQFQEIDDLFHLEAQTVLNKDLVRVLSANGLMRLSTDGDIQEIPLDGAIDHIGALVAACGT